MRGTEEARQSRRPQRSDVMIRAREKILTLLRRNRTPLNAYDLLHRLNRNGWQLKPPQIYRLLALLQEQGFVHRVESQSAFTACRAHGHQDMAEAQFLVCSVCGDVAEVRSSRISQLLSRIAKHERFQVRKQIVEILGTCGNCAAKSQAADTARKVRAG